jgi:hypothetical protein
LRMRPDGGRQGKGRCDRIRKERGRVPETAELWWPVRCASGVKVARDGDVLPPRGAAGAVHSIAHPKK